MDFVPLKPWLLVSVQGVITRVANHLLSTYPAPLSTQCLQIIRIFIHDSMYRHCIAHGTKHVGEVNARSMC